MQKIYFVTGNDQKAREVAAIVPEVERIDLDLSEIQSLDPAEVITAKLKEAHAQIPERILVVEDVTLTISSLGNLPGTLVKWFIKSIGPDGMYDLVKDKDTSAVVAANLGLVYPDGSMIFVKGEVPGKIVHPNVANHPNFDSIFMPDGQGKRYLEMTSEEKSRISHRALAWHNLKKQLSLK